MYDIISTLFVVIQNFENLPKIKNHYFYLKNLLNPSENSLNNSKPLLKKCDFTRKSFHWWHCCLLAAPTSSNCSEHWCKILDFSYALFMKYFRKIKFLSNPLLSRGPHNSNQIFWIFILSAAHGKWSNLLKMYGIMFKIEYNFW